MYNPESTYRVQLHKDFGFAELETIIPYLHRLGIKTVYASPIFAAMPGSTHGYDGIDPNRINPEIGSWEQFVRICALLKAHGMGWLQDFVPNHMAFAPQNPWIYDVLEKGPGSSYYHYFDIRDNDPLMVPVLNEAVDQAIAGQQLQIVNTGQRLAVRYADTYYPLNDRVYHFIPGISQPLPGTQEDRQQQFALVMADPARKQIIERRLEFINATPALLLEVLRQQHYRFCDWRETNTRINYRRFFSINSLIGMNMHLDDVFDGYHRLLLRMASEGLIQGIRIDHIDGLQDPAAYLDRLRQQAGPDMYICVEKILGNEEQLPRNWPVAGTTGYDFINKLTRVMIPTGAPAQYREAYRKITGEQATPGELVLRYKEQVLFHSFSGELDYLHKVFLALPGLTLPSAVDAEAIKQVIAHVLVYCPVYRLYPSAIPLTGEDLQTFERLMEAVANSKYIALPACQYFKDLLTGHLAVKEDRWKNKALAFWQQCMQLAGPLMAKGVEDTLLYNYMPFLACNEVGVPPDLEAMDSKTFHDHMRYRLLHCPDTMNATATHDTKRGEDTRARLLQAGAQPEAWSHTLETWLSGDTAAPLPAPEDRHFLLQAVYGAVPRGSVSSLWQTRLQAYITKAAREAKKKSGWEQPDPGYESLLSVYALAAADPQTGKGHAIQEHLRLGEQEIIRTALSQVALKCTCPGIPDVYQGTELWDLSFVDPDNRRPVDYNQRAQLLDQILQMDDPVTAGRLTSGNIKLYTLHRLLQLRRSSPELFSKGSYEAVAAPGGWLSFIRRYKGQWLWVMLPLPGTVTAPSGWPRLPAEAPASWYHLFTGAAFNLNEGSFAESSAAFPVFVAHGSHSGDNRSAGVLAPLSAIAADTGIGNIGRAARHFIDFLAQGGQKKWQMLPLNPVLEANAFSPYAAAAAFAGDPVYIDTKALKPFSATGSAVTDKRSAGSVDYPGEKLIREQELSVAWQYFRQHASGQEWRSFVAFCASETWLNDYVCYTVLKVKHQNQPWYDWPQPYRDRDEAALARFRNEERDGLLFEQWKQFIFREQWKDLRQYAAQHNIQLVGDLPFYMSTDSADVWAHPTLFRLNGNGRPAGVAGVPPDYFSDTGQLWGMPTYNWEEMASDGYAWWIARLENNIALYDIVRLDHFRAFYDYWEVPEGHQTALHGSWRQGPGEKLFDILRQHFPAMPFLAEDLGDIHPAITGFRKKYHLPGMYVLQFGFEHYDPTLSHLPHNFEKQAYVYSGTHDNNTTRGWFEESGAESRAALSAYAGYTVTPDTAADTLIQLAFRSVAATAIIPLQDYLNLGAGYRTNTPATAGDNWTWKLQPGMLTPSLAAKLLSIVRRFNR